MRVFVSGQMQEKENIQRIYSKLIEHGFGITHDWTRTDDLAVEAKQSVEAGRRAEKDIIGVCNADIYLIDTNNYKCGKGMYVELGAALAKAELGQNIAIYIVGPRNHNTIFYSHPSCKYFENIEDCLSEIITDRNLSHSHQLKFA